ncbi:hypothetical protein [Acinetobacter sp. 'aerobic (ED)']|uniref:hypothetical protein n=1 Tax=Acinetobacter sp. 'aerobic (ED)' TaxID=174230 RepID=UPI00192C3E8D|nr:hypothetical protein [Acinetobacter sp. 'aerobic (ED)']
MAVDVKNIIPTKFLENTDTTQFVAKTSTTIDKFTVTNTSADIVTFSCNLVLSGGIVGPSNLVIKEKAVAAGETYVCPELVGHSLEAGSFINTLADTADALTVRASGREIT